MPEASLDVGEEIGASPFTGEISWQREIPSGCALLPRTPPSPGEKLRPMSPSYPG